MKLWALLLVVFLVVAGGIERAGGSAHAGRTTSAPQPALATIGLVLDFACIHKYEGAWDANTGNGYYGGLQMDKAFEARYGAELLRSRGHADHWSPEQQIAVAIRAYKTRGFKPWPNTRRSCGL
jgi:hypothetical protein